MAIYKGTTPIGGNVQVLNEEVFNEILSANTDMITVNDGWLKKQNDVCYLVVSFTIKQTRPAGALFRLPKYLAPETATTFGDICDNNGMQVSRFCFPSTGSSEYNQGYIISRGQLEPGTYVIRHMWMD